MTACLLTRVRKQPIIALYFEFETVLKFYNLRAWTTLLLQINLANETSFKATEIFSHRVKRYQQKNAEYANNLYRRHANQYGSDSSMTSF